MEETTTTPTTPKTSTVKSTQRVRGQNKTFHFKVVDTFFNETRYFHTLAEVCEYTGIKSMATVSVYANKKAKDKHMYLRRYEIERVNIDPQITKIQEEADHLFKAVPANNFLIEPAQEPKAMPTEKEILVQALTAVYRGDKSKFWTDQLANVMADYKQKIISYEEVQEFIKAMNTLQFVE